MNEIEDILKTLNDFSLSVDTTPMILRKPQGSAAAAATPEQRTPLQPSKILNEQANLSMGSQRLIEKVMHDFGSKPGPTIDESFISTGSDAINDSINHSQQLQSTLQAIAPSDWTEQMRNAVHRWVNRERELIDCERAQVSQQLESYAQALVQLQEKYDALQATHQDSVQQYEKLHEQMHKGLMYQQHRIAELEDQLNMKDSVQEKENPNPPSPGESDCTTPHPQDAPFFPSTPDDQENHTNDDNNLRRRRFKTLNDAGNVVIQYWNGAEKEIFDDGTTVTRFANGDVHTCNARTKTSKYYFAASQVTKSTHPEDDSIIYEFAASGQVERHFADGRKLVECSNGQTFWVEPNVDK
ncbi:hypothetical protein MPSEU_000963000 [Mayamaea pseudoterrestris]|nr:hypothetical protein MPSEU_000963000 [Mayamaea pseudoterrestris]